MDRSLMHVELQQLPRDPGRVGGLGRMVQGPHLHLLHRQYQYSGDTVTSRDNLPPIKCHRSYAELTP